MNRITVGYLRCSTEEQVRSGFSIEAQRQEMLRNASDYEYTIDKFYIDDGYSAGSLKRPQVQQLLKDIKLNKIERIIIRHTDRLVRNLVLKKSLERIFELYNVELVSFNGGTNKATPEEQMFSDIMAILDEGELKKVSPRTFKGLKGSAELGNFTLGSVPLGYKRVNNKIGKGSHIEPDEETAPVVIKLFNTLALNKHTITDVVKYLNKEKILNRRWNRDMVTKLIDNPIYYGRLKTSYCDIENHTLPIITKELYDAVQVAVHHYKKRCIHRYYFERLIYDSDHNVWLSNECAWKALSKKRKKMYKYYGCRKHRIRISENKLIKLFLTEYHKTRINDIDSRIMDDLNNAIINNQSKLKILDDDLSNNLISIEDYRKQRTDTLRKIAGLKAELADFKSKKLLPFDKYSEAKKQAIINSNLKIIKYYPSKDIFEFHWRN